MRQNIFKKIAMLLLLGLMFFGITTGHVNAFQLRGYTFNETKDPLNNTNVTIEEYIFNPGAPPTLINSYHNNSNETGFFSVSVPNNPGSNYKIILRHFNSTTSTLDYIGQSLPDFPYQLVSNLTPSPTDTMNFNLRIGGTVNITANNGTDSTTFRYMVKDTKLGYPIAENFADEVSNALVYVPANRNYSIMIFPNRSFPVSYDLDNLTDYSNNYANIPFNTSTTFRRVSGHANLSDGSSNFADLKIIAYLMEPGKMISQDHPLPYNMSSMDCDFIPFPVCGSDEYDPSSGYYNITLPGAAMNANLLLFAAAKNSSTNEYYGAFRNITLGYSEQPVADLNFSMQPLLGNVATITLNNASGPGNPGFPGNITITTRKLPFQLKNKTSQENITGFAHIELLVNYSDIYDNGPTFKWMVQVSQSNNGSFTIPAINANIDKIKVYTQNFAPLKTSKAASELINPPVIINLTSFNPGAINESGQPPEIFIEMLKSNPTCNVPYPPAGCSLTEGVNKTGFNPLKRVIGGGKTSLRMTLLSNNITVHYQNVDMLASGPPDAMFDTSANNSQSGSLLEQAWRFGSMGPEIYDGVLIGIPLDPNTNASNVSIKLGKLYDNNWNTLWNISVNTTNDIPSDFRDFNMSSPWFTQAGLQCSTDNINSDCYVNVTYRMVWLKVPHFSGFSPMVSSETVGGVTATLSPNSSVAGNTTFMNFTIIDVLNATSWYNITFPAGFNAGSAIVNFTINGVNNLTGWANMSTPSYVKTWLAGGPNAANSDTLQYINISNVIVPNTPGSYTINVSTNNSVNISLTYVVTGAASGPAIVPRNTIYEPLSGGYANDIAPNFTLNVEVINVSNGVNASNVQVNILEVNTTGNFLMVPNGSSGSSYYFNLTSRVDKVVRGTFNATVTAYDTIGNSNTSNLSIEAHMSMGVNVIGYNSSKNRPAYPANVSLFFNNSPVIIIINTTDGTNYTNITADFSGVDNSADLEYNNSGVPTGDGNYSYTITHTLGTIPDENVGTVWINATFSTPGGPVVIPRIAALVVVSNMNPRDNQSYNLSGATTDWKDIPDYSAAYLTFEAYSGGNRIATLRFNQPINLTDYTTAINLRLLGEKLRIAERSVNLSAAADALREFNKSANLTIYNLTSFTTSPAIFEDGARIVLPDQTSGGAASDVNWNQSAYVLTFNVSHWTNYSWGTYGINITNISALTGSTVAGTYAAYIFALQNNGTLSDSYNLTISNPNSASTAALNVSGNITLGPNEIRILRLNVTNVSAGTFNVNVTATSLNYSNRTASINTTTVVKGVPTITGVDTIHANGSFRNGEVIDIIVYYSQAVNVTGGVPELALNSGRYATYNSGNGTTALTFRYIVGAADNSPDLDYNGTNSLVLNGSSINDTATGLLNANNNLPSVGTFAAAHDITIDNILPTLTRVSITSDNANATLAKDGDTVTISFTSNEAINPGVSVTLDGYPADTIDNPEGNNWTATFLVSVYTEGLLPITIDFTDIAGNAGNQVTETTDGTGITYDETPPSLTVVRIGSNNADPTKAKVGDMINISLIADENLLAYPVVIIDGQVAAITSTGGNSYNASFTMTGAQSEGLVSFTIDFTDAAGNVGSQVTATTDASSVTFDKSAPILTLVRISSNNANPAKARVGDRVNISLTSNETISANPVVAIDGQAAATTGTGGNSYNASFTMTSSQNDGVVNFTIDFTDAAGNAGTQITATTDSSSVTFDKIAPVLTLVRISSNNTNPAKAKVGDRVNISLTSNETLSANPVVTISGQNAAITGTGGNSYNASFTMTGAQSEGSVSFTIDFTDAAGNAGTQVTATTDSSSVTFDRSPPALIFVRITSSNANQTRAKSGDIVTVAMTANETLNATPAATIASQNASVSNTGGNSYNATYTMQSGDTEGAVAFTITFADDTGNAGTQVTTTTDASSVTYDRTPPVITFMPANESLNSTGHINVTVTLNEPGTVTLNWNGANESMQPAGPGMNFYNNKSVNLSGNYSFKIYANDIAGNNNATEVRIVTVNRTNTTVLTGIINTTTFIINETINITSPNGNVTVTIFNGTNASVNGTAVVLISIDSLAQTNSTFMANLGSDKLIGENLTLGPEGARFSPDIQIRFNYTGAQLTAAGISASQLRVKFYNTTMDAWVEQTPYILYENGSDGYLLANISHFSTFALIGVPATTTTTTTSGSSGGGGGGGGGGGASGENYSNIIVKEKHDLHIFKDKVTSYAFTNRSNPILFVNITGNLSAGEVNTAVEVLKNTSTLVKTTAPGIVYKNANIWVGTSGFAVAKNIREATIRFRVENAWLATKGLTANDIRMAKWDKTQWIQIETMEKDRDDTYTYFEAKTVTFSSFAITGIKGEIIPTASASEGISEPPTEVTWTEIPKEKSPGFEYVMVLAALSAVYLFARRRH